MHAGVVSALQQHEVPQVQHDLHLAAVGVQSDEPAAGVQLRTHISWRLGGRTAEGRGTAAGGGTAGTRTADEPNSSSENVLATKVAMNEPYSDSTRRREELDRGGERRKKKGASR